MEVASYKRFWGPRDIEIEPGLDGYLPDPEDDGAYYNPELREFGDLAHIPCMVLLGEPGAGKTTTLQPHLSDEARGHQWLDLKAYGDEARLVAQLREMLLSPSPTGGRDLVTLTLDSFDECLIRIDTLAALLPEELGKITRNNIHLRIICRPSVWPTSLEDALGKLWPSVGVFKLAPLRRRDVADAALAAKVNPETFVEAVHAQQLQPLARQRVSLNLLLRVFRERGTALAVDRRDLYHRGCLSMLEYDSRQGTSLKGRLAVRERLTIAGRIAALSILCGRARVAIVTAVGDGSVLPFGDITGGAEPVDGHDIEITPDAVREVLDKPLFTPAGPGTLEFAHRTYAEYLAAWYLHERGLETPQIVDLVTDESSRSTVVPQLREVVSWLALMNTSIRRDLLPIDPSLAVDDAVAASSDAFKAQIVKALLAACDQRRLIHSDIKQARKLAALTHRGLADQIRGPIKDGDTFVETRRIALEIANHCEIVDVSDELAAVALDPQMPVQIRGDAAHALTKFGTREAKHRLRAVLAEATPDGYLDDVRGHALRCLWPDVVSTSEVFERFAEPSERWSAHVEFLQDLVGQLNGVDLIPALSWVSSRPRRFGSSQVVIQMINTCLVRATKQSGQYEELGPALANAVLSRLSLHEQVLSTDHGEEEARSDAINEEDRRRLVALIVAHLKSDAPMPNVVWGSDLLTPNDRWWVLEQCQRRTATTSEKERWLAILEGISRFPDAFDDVVFRDEVITLAWLDADARRQLHFLAPVEIASESAQEARARHDQWRAFDAMRTQRREREASRVPFDRLSAVSAALSEPTEDPVNDWTYVTDAILADAEGRFNAHGTDVASASGWPELPQSVQADVLYAALKLLGSLTPPEGWTSLGGIPRQVRAGYRALRLLVRVNQELLEQLSVSTWTRWAETILGWSFDDGKDDRQMLLRLLQQSAPSALVDAVRVVARSERTRRGSFHFTYRLAGLWDDVLCDTVINELSHVDVPSDAFAHGLAEMLKGSAPGAESLATRLVANRASYDDARVDVAAALLLAHSATPPWSSIWPLLEANLERGLRILILAMNANRHLRFNRYLSANEAGNLFIWLARAYPPADDPRRPQVHTPTKNDYLIEFRVAVLAELAARGTEDSFQQVLRIRTEVRHPTDFARTILSARRALVQRTWRPVAVPHLLAMARDSRKRTVRSAADLADVVVRALERVQDRLQGQTAEKEQLWNEQGFGKQRSGAWVPKDEANLSNYVKNRLEEIIGGGQIVLNREVELRPGEESDIYIQAISPPGSHIPTIAIVVEVKGCWNAGLMQSMRTQLQERYLQNLTDTHGVYVVGWFLCPQWIKSDDRWKKTPKRTIDELRDELAEQAHQLTTLGTPIHAFVLDARLHGAPAPVPVKRKRRRGSTRSRA